MAEDKSLREQFFIGRDRKSTLNLNELKYSPAELDGLYKQFNAPSNKGVGFRKTVSQDVNLEGHGEGRLVIEDASPSLISEKGKESVRFIPKDEDFDKAQSNKATALMIGANLPAIASPVAQAYAGRGNLRANLLLNQRNLKMQNLAKTFSDTSHNLYSGVPLPKALQGSPIQNPKVGSALAIRQPTIKDWDPSTHGVNPQGYPKSHFRDYLKYRKGKNFPKEGEKGFLPFPAIYQDYISTYGDRTFQGELYRAKTSKGAISISTAASRKKHSETWTQTRLENIEFNPNKSTLKAFNNLKSLVSTNNKKEGFSGGTSGWIVEHNIPAKSRYWKVNSGKEMGWNSDPNNTFAWREPAKVTYKGAVEKHLFSKNKFPGEPYASRVDRNTNEMVMIHIDSNREMGRWQIGSKDFRKTIQQLIKKDNINKKVGVEPKSANFNQPTKSVEPAWSGIAKKSVDASKRLKWDEAVWRDSNTQFTWSRSDNSGYIDIIRDTYAGKDFYSIKNKFFQQIEGLPSGTNWRLSANTTQKYGLYKWMTRNDPRFTPGGDTKMLAQRGIDHIDLKIP